MQAVAKILRARASEHSYNFCEQFEQRPNFASTLKFSETIRYPYYCVSYHLSEKSNRTKYALLKGVLYTSEQHFKKKIAYNPNKKYWTDISGESSYFCVNGTCGTEGVIPRKICWGRAARLLKTFTLFMSQIFHIPYYGPPPPPKMQTFQTI